MSHSLALLLINLGRFDEAVALDERAIVLDPLRSTVHITSAIPLTALGRYEEAEAALRKAIALQPQSGATHKSLAVIQILRGKPAAAVELAKQETDPFWRTDALALAYFAHGDQVEADVQLKNSSTKMRTTPAVRSRKSMPCAKNRRKCSSGWTAPGARTTAVSLKYWLIPSCAPTRTTRASSPSRKRSE